MFPQIDKEKTGKHLAELFRSHGVTVKQVQEYLGLACVQSVYHWLDGSSLPTVDNLYALSEFLDVPVDQMLCGNRKTGFESNLDMNYDSRISGVSLTENLKILLKILCDILSGKPKERYRRLCIYYLRFYGEMVG